MRNRSSPETFCGQSGLSTFFSQRVMIWQLLAWCLVLSFFPLVDVFVTVRQFEALSQTKQCGKRTMRIYNQRPAKVLGTSNVCERAHNVHL
jgi:hypothetical protein